MVNGPLTILGAGSWGTALAVHYAKAGTKVRLWARDPEQAAAVAVDRVNPAYLPGVDVPDEVEVTSDLTQAVQAADPVLLAVPSAAVRDLASAIREDLEAGARVVGLAKGLERASGLRMSQVLDDALGAGRHAQLLGPSHAEEVARSLPTAIVLAGADPDWREDLQARLSSDSLRVYTNEDLVGVELAAALKNVLAIAAGICDGLGLGDNTKGALLTRGVAEMARLGTALGAARETFYGLAGIGDVIATCLSQHSRNRAFGEWIGAGQTLEEAQRRVGQVVEGAATTRTACDLARQQNVAMPITTTVEQVVFQGMEPGAAIAQLMTRSLRAEGDPQTSSS